MTKPEAKKLAASVSPDDLRHMMFSAFSLEKNWDKPSSANKSISIGAMYNIFIKCDINEKTPMIVKVNMIRQFGKYLPNYAPPERKPRKNAIRVYHEEPKTPPQEYELKVFNSNGRWYPRQQKN